MTTAAPAGLDSPENVGGFVFVAPKRGPTQEGPMILDRDGEVVWFHPVAGDQQAFDFRVQQYEGRDVLTWWQGAVALYRGFGSGRVLDSSYREIARVEMANGSRWTRTSSSSPTAGPRWSWPTCRCGGTCPHSAGGRTGSSRTA